MLLSSINSLKDLKNLDLGQLDILAEEIRSVIIETVGKTGGHLGSNLGIVELTIALHRIFDSPKDILLWDVGHQTYVHKILTGRKKEFETLRQPEGISGYPSQQESDHDWIENSHASTVLSYAHGIASAESLKGTDRRVVAIIGDGSLTGGMAFEGLNNLGHSGEKVTVVLNDNGRSYAPTISRLSESLIRIRSNPRYMRRQHKLEELAERIPWVGELLERGINATKAAIREMFEPPAFFEALGMTYLGPFDGHDIQEIEQALSNASEFEGPVVVHVLTQKGRGYAPAEQDSVKHMHDTSGIKSESYTEAFSEAIVKIGESNSEVVTITAAMPDSTGLLPFREKFPERFFDVGIAEQHAVTAAAGMAMAGLRPVVAIYSTFLTRAIDQINLDIALHKLPVVFCIDRAGITGDDGPSHHGLLDITLLSKVPGMRIFAPSSYQELQQMLKDAVEMDGGPVAIRWSKTPAPQTDWAEVGSGIEANKVFSSSTNHEVCILAAGKMLENAKEAAEKLKTDGIEVTVWDPRIIYPLNEEMLKNASLHKVVVTIEDGYVEGGFGSLVLDSLNRSNSRCRIINLGVPLAFHLHNKPESLMSSFGLDTQGITEKIRTSLDEMLYES